MRAPLIQCVIVLYKQRLTQALSLSSLLQICAEDPAVDAKLEILVQDNSPEAQLLQPDSSSERFEYFHDPTNPGLAAAYNRALGKAKREGILWVLTLDQDTALDRNFFLQLLAALQSEESEKACAYVPELVKKELVLSPQVVGKVYYHRIPFGFSGFADKPIVAFNSAACLNVRALTAIGGYPKEYWLDYLDHIVFHRIQAAGGRVFILNSQLDHSLSLQDIELEVSFERYSNVLGAEWMFVRDSSSTPGFIIHRLRLLKRAIVQGLKLKNKSYAKLTLRASIQGINAPHYRESRGLGDKIRGPFRKP